MNILKTVYNKLTAPLTKVPPSLSEKHFTALDGLRGVAILIVLLVHIGVNQYIYRTGFYFRSDTGVHIFFVISGFLITTLLLKEKLNTGDISLKRFYMRRALRILPVAYLFLLVLIILNRTFGLGISAADFLASFLFYKNLPMRNEPFTAHFWTLAVEQQFYLTFPCLLAYNIERYFFVTLSMVVIVPVIAMLSNLGLGVLQHNAVGMWLAKLCAYAFWKGPVIILIGSVAAVLTFKGIMGGGKAGFFTSLVLLIAAILITLHGFPVYDAFISTYLSAILVAFAIVTAVSNDDLLTKVLSGTIIKRLGILSYSIYIWQQLFIGTRQWQPWLHFLKDLPLWIPMLIKLVVIIILASASYVFEAIFLRMKKRLSKT